MSTLPPGPRGMIRNTFQVMMDPYHFYAHNYDKYGDIFTAKTFNGTVVCAMNTETIRTIFSQPIGTYAPFGADTAIPIVGRRSVMTTGGEAHRKQRKLLSPPFKTARMGAYGPVIAATVHENIEKMSVNSRIDMHAVGNRISLENIIKAVFGVQKSDEQAQFIAAIDDFVAKTNPTFIFCKPLQNNFFGLSPWYKFQKARRHLYNLLSSQISERRQEQNYGEDILSRLLLELDEAGEEFSEEALLDNLVSLLFAGHETTGIALSWVMYWLQREPEVRSRLIDELDLHGAGPSLDEIAKNPWLDAVIKESLRLNPILGDVLRTLLKPLELQGYQLEPGISVSAGIGGIHYREDLYPDPHRFNPQRFIDRSYSPWEYMPFGGGLRRCPGSAFATFELKIAAVTLLHRCSFNLEKQDVGAVRKNLTMAPKGGVPMTVTDIRPAGTHFMGRTLQAAHA